MSLCRALGIAWMGAALFAFISPAFGSGGYATVDGPCHFSFPRDHGAHFGHRTEWWYYTGNVRTEQGRRYGFQLTFFRTRILAPGAEDPPPEPSAWRTSQIYLAHAAVSDLEEERHLQAERIARGAVGLAGVQTDDGRVRVMLNDWSARIEGDTHRLKASDAAFSLDLVLTAQKPVVAHGDQGYSVKGAGPGRASCYYSVTRLAAAGRIGTSGALVPVNGTAWMDHEYSTSPLEPGLTGWDWFSIQLSDGSDLMLYRLRDAQNGTHSASSGTWVGPQGTARHLGSEDFRITETDSWTSPASGAAYPAGWNIQIPSLEMSLTVSPAMADQEMKTPETTNVVYWEGSVVVQGNRGDVRIRGVGYTELTGYAAPFDAPM